jgi:transcriptional regulator with XRE-family HTH domain
MSGRRGPDPALAVVLRRFRHRAGISQEDLAYESGVTISALSRIERGISNPTWSSVRALARVLGVRMDELGAAVEMEGAALSVIGSLESPARSRDAGLE